MKNFYENTYVFADKLFKLCRKYEQSNGCKVLSFFLWIWPRKWPGPFSFDFISGFFVENKARFSLYFDCKPLGCHWWFISHLRRVCFILFSPSGITIEIKNKIFSRIPEKHICSEWCRSVIVNIISEKFRHL